MNKIDLSELNFGDIFQLRNGEKVVFLYYADDERLLPVFCSEGGWQFSEDVDTTDHTIQSPFDIVKLLHKANYEQN